MSSKDSKEFKIEKVFLKNYKGIDEENINLKCQSFIIWASNAKGKTSFLNSVEDLFVGKNVGAPQIKKGADKSEIWAVIKETGSGVRYKVKRVITEKTTRLEIICDSDPNFKPEGGPQTWINDVLGQISFNIGDLLSKSKEEQVKELKKLCNIDTTNIDIKLKEAETQRTDFNTLLKNAKAKFEAVKAPSDEDLEKFKETKNSTELNAKLVKQVEINAKHTQLEQDIENNKKAVADLEKKLEAAETLLKEQKAQKEKLEKFEDITLLSKEIEDVNDHNEQVRKNTEFLTLQKEYEENKASAELWQSRVELARKKRQEYIQSAKLPVDGLSFDEEKGIMYKEIPLSEHNTAEKAFVEAMIKMSRQSVNLKVIRIENASLLDDENIKRLTEKCKEAGYQVGFEMVSRTPQDLKVEYLDETEGTVTNVID
jgi:hypothetical protein